MNNANHFPGVRIPRNALRVWQSDLFFSTASGEALTKSLRLAVPSSPNMVHPLDWPLVHRAVDGAVVRRGVELDSVKYGLGMG